MIPAQLPAAGASIGHAERERPQQGGDAWRAAWQREVERHQVADWFGHGVVGGGGVGASLAAALRHGFVSEHDSAGAQPHEGRMPTMQPAADDLMPEPASLPSASRWQQQASQIRADAGRDARSTSDTAPAPGTQARDARDCAAPAPRNALPPRAPTAAAWQIDDPFASAAEGTNAADPVARSAQQAPAREPVRVHAEWSDAGVRLWLGIDAEAAASQTRLVQQIQRSVARSGHRVLQVTCNGQAVPQRPTWQSNLDGFTATESSTWPSAQ